MQNCGLSSDVGGQIVLYGILIRRRIWAAISLFIRDLFVLYYICW